MDIGQQTLGFIKKQRSRYLVTCSSVTSLATTHLAMVSFFSFLSTFYIKILKCGYKLIYYSAIFSHLDLLDKSCPLPLILALVYLALRLLPPQHRDVLRQLVDHMHLQKNTTKGKCFTFEYDGFNQGAGVQVQPCKLWYGFANFSLEATRNEHHLCLCYRPPQLDEEFIKASFVQLSTIFLDTTFC